MAPLEASIPFQQAAEADGVIVVVDDDLDTVQMLGEVIEGGTSYQAFLLQTPAEVLRHLEDLAGLKPSLFLLNFVLPTMTGVE